MLDNSVKTKFEYESKKILKREGRNNVSCSNNNDYSINNFSSSNNNGSTEYKFSRKNAKCNNSL